MTRTPGPLPGAAPRREPALAEVHAFEEGDLPRRLRRMTQETPR
ncbi:hypothetical protein ACFC1T_18680 [Kitasatospora sp. NPDC056076]